MNLGIQQRCNPHLNPVSSSTDSPRPVPQMTPHPPYLPFPITLALFLQDFTPMTQFAISLTTTFSTIKLCSNNTRVTLYTTQVVTQISHQLTLAAPHPPRSNIFCKKPNGPNKVEVHLHLNRITFWGTRVMAFFMDYPSWLTQAGRSKC